MWIRRNLSDTRAEAVGDTGGERPPQQIPRPKRHSASEASEIIENIPACVCYLCSVAQWPPIDRLLTTPISPPSGPTQWLFQKPPAESKFLAAWSLSNLVALLRWNLFTHKDLWKRIDDPFMPPPEPPPGTLVQAELDGIARAAAC